MGATVCRAVTEDPELTLVAALDPRMAGIDLSQASGIAGTGIQMLGSADALEGSSIDVAVDFTKADAAFANAMYCAKAGIHAVIGTTGMTHEQMETLAQAFGESSANCIVAANFAIGAVLMMKFAEIAAPLFESVEIIELHHDNKVDAPSGTALSTAARIAASRGDGIAAKDKTTSELLGARGHLTEGKIRVHSLRIKGMVAHQEVIFGTTGQTLTIRHDSYDRTSFMPGVLLAIKSVASLEGLTVGLDQIIESALRG